MGVGTAPPPVQGEPVVWWRWQPAVAVNPNPLACAVSPLGCLLRVKVQRHQGATRFLPLCLARGG